MTRDEFKDWFRYFRGSFPSIAAWLAKHPAKREDDEPMAFAALPTQQDILRGWFKTLEKVELVDAKKATDQLSLGDEENDYIAFDRSAARIRQISLRLGRDRRFCEPKKFDSREPRYDCWRCEDTGFVPIICPKDIKVIAEQWPEGPPDKFDYSPICDQASKPLHLGRWGIDCSCPRGYRGSEFRYDEDKHCYFTGHNYEQVRAWFVAYNDRYAASRQFAEWAP